MIPIARSRKVAVSAAGAVLLAAIVVTVTRAEAGTPVGPLDVFERSKSCVEELGKRVCHYRFTKPYPFWMVIRAVGAPNPVVEVRDADSQMLFYPRITLGDPCVQVRTALKDRAAYVSTATGNVYRSEDACRADVDRHRGGADAGA